MSGEKTWLQPILEACHWQWSRARAEEALREGQVLSPGGNMEPGSSLAAGLYYGCPRSKDRRRLTTDCPFWCPQGWPGGRYVSLASSRLGNRLRQDRRVSDALRNFFILSQHDDVVVSGSGTSLDLPVRRGCHLFGRPCLRLIPFPRELTADWVRSTTAATVRGETGIYFDATLRSADELAFAVSDLVRVIHIRKTGNIDRLARRYAAEGPGPLVMRLVGDVQPSAGPPASHLEGDGMIAWYLYGPGSTGTSDRPSGLLPSPLLEPDQLKGEYLSHWTRAERHPWPDQTSLSQFDRLFLDEDRLSGPLETLCRILVQQRLLASGRLIRGGRPVVCFTAVPLREFRRRRIFRPQLSRWDFEPFGVVVRRRVLQRLGARPVKYVRQPAPPAGARAHSQPVVHVGNRSAAMDWSAEREWRLCGDLDLRQLGPDEAAVFVPDQAAARVVAGLSRWPIVILPPAASDDAESPGRGRRTSVQSS
jgi:hypothetical protein